MMVVMLDQPNVLSLVRGRVVRTDCFAMRVTCTATVCGGYRHTVSIAGSHAARTCP